MVNSKLKDRKAEVESVASVKGRNRRICSNVPNLVRIRGRAISVSSERNYDRVSSEPGCVLERTDNDHRGTHPAFATPLQGHVVAIANCLITLAGLLPRFFTRQRTRRIHGYIGDVATSLPNESDSEQATAAGYQYTSARKKK